MTFIQTVKFHDAVLYRVYEYGSFGVHIKYCTLDEVMYILSTKEQK